VRDQFLVELAHTNVEGIDELNRLFSAWVESVYHRTTHSETDQTPLGRFLAGGAPIPPAPERLREAFLWAERRQVTKTAEIALFGNRYEVDAALVGERIEAIFDPFDLTHIEVRFAGRPLGVAAPRRIGRHVHPAARAEPGPKTPPTSGIDYLRLIEARRRAELSRRIDYRDLPSIADTNHHPGDSASTAPDLSTEENPQ
jgi:putative transposase